MFNSLFQFPSKIELFILIFPFFSFLFFYLIIYFEICIDTTFSLIKPKQSSTVHFFIEGRYIPANNHFFWSSRQIFGLFLQNYKYMFSTTWSCSWSRTQQVAATFFKRYLLPFDHSMDVRLYPSINQESRPKNYRGVTFTAIAAKVYNALLLNRIQSKIEETLRKNQNSFLRNRSTTSKILTIRRRRARKKSRGNTAVHRFFQGIWFHRQTEDGASTFSTWSPPRNCYSYNDALWKDKNFFAVVAGVLQGDTLMPYLFILCLNYVLRTSIYQMKENGFTLKKVKKATISWRNYDRCRQRRWSRASGKYTFPINLKEVEI